MALPASSPSGGLSGSQTGSRIPGLHTTVSEQVFLPDPVSLARDCGCSEADARSRTCGVMEAQGWARRRKERKRKRTGERWTERSPMISLSQEGSRWIRGLSWRNREKIQLAVNSV